MFIDCIMKFIIIMTGESKVLFKNHIFVEERNKAAKHLDVNICFVTFMEVYAHNRLRMSEQYLLQCIVPREQHIKIKFLL
jgi:hypothetical protein